MADIKERSKSTFNHRRILMMRISTGSMPEHFILFYGVSWRIFRSESLRLGMRDGRDDENAAAVR